MVVFLYYLKDVPTTIPHMATEPKVAPETKMATAARVEAQPKPKPIPTKTPEAPHPKGTVIYCLYCSFLLPSFYDMYALFLSKSNTMSLCLPVFIDVCNEICMHLFVLFASL